VKTEVTVTGTRTPVEIESSPVSSALVSRQELEHRDIRLIDKAIEGIPGVISLRARGASDNDFGLGLRGFAGRGGQVRTLILLDDQPINNSFNGSVNWSMFSPQDLERVEIARGPFSSLYGGNAMGGVINLISRRPDGRHGDFFYQYGSRATDNYSAHLTDRYFDRLGLTVGYTGYKTGGYSPQGGYISSSSPGGTSPFVTGVMQLPTSSGGVQYQVGRRGAEWFKSSAFRARAEYTFSPRIFGYLQFIHLQRGDDYGPYNSFLRTADGLTVDSGSYRFVDNSGVSRQLSISSSSFIGTPTGATTNFYHGQVHAQLTPAWMIRVTAGLNSNPTNWYTQAGSTATYAGGPGTYTAQFGQSLYGNILVNHTARGQTLLFGTEARGDRAATTTFNLANFRDRTKSGSVTRYAFGKTIDQSGYVQYQGSFRDRLNIVAGGRYDYWRTYDGGNLASATAVPLAYGDRSAQAFTGKLAINYRLPDGWHLRASIGNAFRGPSVYELYYNFVLIGTRYVANPNERPEHLTAYEAGVAKTFAGRYSIEATGYTNRVKDLIYRTTDQTDPTGATKILTNAGMSRTWGLEFSTKQRVFNWLRLQQGYAYTNSIILDNPSLPTTVGKNLPYVPAHVLSYQATATPSHFILNWTGRYVSPVYSTDTNTDTVHNVPGSYDLFFEMDGTVTYEATRHISIVANADNMLDRKYFLYFNSLGRSLFIGTRVHF
jgi:iron complex outermembrane receptor protein